MASHCSGAHNDVTTSNDDATTTVQLLLPHIRAIPDFPKPGIAFRDIFPLMRNVEAFTACINMMTSHVQSACRAAMTTTNGSTDSSAAGGANGAVGVANSAAGGTSYLEGVAIVGLDARGFIFGPMIAQRLGLPFAPIRKAGKLPGETIQTAYQLEYGEATFEIQKDALTPGQKVIIVDDLLATGGTMKAACNLVTQLQCSIIECLVLIELKDLNGRSNVPANLHSFIQY